MKSVSRVVSTAFWNDEKVVNDFSPEDKYFFLYLLTNPHTSQLGIYKLVPKTAAFEMGYSVEAVTVLLDRFENKYGMIRYSKKTSEVAIKNYLRWSVLKGGKPVMDCLLQEEKQVEDKSLLLYLSDNLNCKDNLNKTVIDYISHIDTDINNNNDNDNERYVNVSYHDSYYDSYHESSDAISPVVSHVKRFVPPTVEEVRDYCVSNDKRYVNPESFVSFYASKNWMVGKNKMSSWTQAVAGWNARSEQRGDRPYFNQQTAKRGDSDWQ